MITGETSKGRFIIATPTKCGTTTLEALAKRHMRNAGADADQFRIMDWDSPRRQHRMALPPVADSASNNEWNGETSGENEWGAATRYLFVRNPYTRYMSMYTYLSAPANYSQWGAREIQGIDWGGPGGTMPNLPPKKTFEEFLHWLAARRWSLSKKTNAKRRGSLWDGRAYRSPWVWTDSLWRSYDLLQGQPGPAEANAVALLRLEQVWEDLAALKEAWDIDSLVLGGLHSNRSTGYGEEGADPSSREFWGGVRCARKAFAGREFLPAGVEERSGCSCGACEVGVASEAEFLGYLG